MHVVHATSASATEHRVSKVSESRSVRGQIGVAQVVLSATFRFARNQAFGKLIAHANTSPSCKAGPQQIAQRATCKIARALAIALCPAHESRHQSCVALGMGIARFNVVGLWRCHAWQLRCAQDWGCRQGCQQRQGSLPGHSIRMGGSRFRSLSKRWRRSSQSCANFRPPSSEACGVGKSLQVCCVARNKA